MKRIQSGRLTLSKQTIRHLTDLRIVAGGYPAESESFCDQCRKTHTLCGSCDQSVDVNCGGGTGTCTTGQD